MPPRKSPPAPKPVVEEEPVEELAVPFDNEAPEDAPVEGPVEDVVEDQPEEPEDVPTEPEDVDAPAAEEEGGAEVGLSPGEEFISQRLRDDAVLVVVTNFGRKIEIDPDGKMTVVTGPPLDVVIPAQPVPTPVGVLGPKPEAG